MADPGFLNLVGALRGDMFPELPAPSYTSVLSGVRAAVAREMGLDVAWLRHKGDESLAARYARELCRDQGRALDGCDFEELLEMIEGVRHGFL